MTTKKMLSQVKPSAHLNDIKFPWSKVIQIVFSFALAVLDMIFLYKAIGKLPIGFNAGMSMFIAFMIATIANVNALLWGYQTGHNLQEKSINKYSRGYFIGWVIIGGVYAMIRGFNILNLFLEKDGIVTFRDIQGELFQIIVLGISYIGTGTLISSCMAGISNRTFSDARKYEQRFAILYDDTSKETAELQALIKILVSQNKTYASLEKQRLEIQKGIYRSEKAAMSDIVGNVIQENPEVAATDAYEEMDEFLSKRLEENEEGL